MSTQDTTNKVDSPGMVVNPEAITRLDTRLAQLTRDGAFSGSVLIAHEENILFNRGYGFADRAKGIPNTPQTRFHLGSMTKTFTAMGILILGSQGKLSVNDLICNYITDCPKEWQDITIHHLLTHTSGLSSQLSTQLYREIESATSGPVAPTEQAHYLGLDSQWSLDTQPGERYVYNNFGYILLAHIIERVSGQTYAVFLKHAIFIPLTMNNSGYQTSSSGVALTYMDGATTTAEQWLDRPIAEGTGHLYSTTEDLFRWDQALYTDQLLPRAELERMFTRFVPEIEKPGFGYGYGWFLGELPGVSIIACSGGGPSFATILMRFPQYRMTEIVLANQGNTDPSVSGGGGLISELFG
jgi:CubicO group peptidase (beta-lactamase class C family)